MALKPQFVNGAIRGGNFILSFILVPLQAREFGASNYAAIVLATSAFTIIGLLDFGFAFSLQQDAASTDINEKNRVRSLMGDIVYLQSAAAFLGLVIGTIYICVSPHTGFGFASHRAQTTFIFVLGWQLFSLPGACYWRWLLGSGRAARASVVANSQTFFVLALTLLTQFSGIAGIKRDFFLCAGYGAPGLIALFEVITSFRHRYRPGARGRLKGYFARSIGWTPLALINSVCSQIPVFLISTQYSAAAVASYSIGSRLFNYPLSIAQIVLFDYWPRLRLSLNKREFAFVNASVRRSALWLLLSGGICFASIAGFSTEIFRFWHVPVDMIPDRTAFIGLGISFVAAATLIPITNALSALEARFSQSVLLAASSIVILMAGFLTHQPALFLVLCGAIGLLSIPAWWAVFVRQMRFQQNHC
jgi:O-antigen/teichoic acid export membrane protein